MTVCHGWNERNEKEGLSGENGLKHPYKIIEILYDSPSSKVVRGKECGTGRTVVLKTGGQEQMSAEAAERLKHEYQVMQQADSSPCGESRRRGVVIDGRYYLAEEYYPGITLSRMLKAGCFGNDGLLPDCQAAGDRTA